MVAHHHGQVLACPPRQAVQRGLAAPQRRLIGHIIMDEEEGVQQLQPRSEAPQPRGGPPWALPKKTSTVMLLDATGAVVYSYSGRLEAAERKTFFDSLSLLLGVELGAEPKP